MPKYLAKLSKFGGQYRLTLPRLLIEEMAWDDVEYITLGPQIDKSIIIRRFVDAESLGIKSKRDRTGKD